MQSLFRAAQFDFGTGADHAALRPHSGAATHASVRTSMLHSGDRHLPTREELWRRWQGPVETMAGYAVAAALFLLGSVLLS